GVNGGAVNYGADPYNNTGALFDVTSGSKGSCSPAYFCTAVSGYDGPTGLGTPNVRTAFRAREGRRKGSAFLIGLRGIGLRPNRRIECIAECHIGLAL